MKSSRHRGQSRRRTPRRQSLARRPRASRESRGGPCEDPFERSHAPRRPPGAPWGVQLAETRALRGDRAARAPPPTARSALEAAARARSPPLTPAPRRAVQDHSRLPLARVLTETCGIPDGAAARARRMAKWRRAAALEGPSCPHPTPGTRRSAATRSRFQSPPRARVAQDGLGAVPGTAGPLRGG